MAKRFLLFTSPVYYPYGGMDDCKGEFTSLNDAVDYATSHNGTHSQDSHILEIGNKLIVWQLSQRTGQVLNATPLAEYIKIESD